MRFDYSSKITKVRSRVEPRVRSEIEQVRVRGDNDRLLKHGMKIPFDKDRGDYELVDGCGDGVGGESDATATPCCESIGSA